MKERVSDYENKKTEERTKIRLFSPLTAIRYPRYDWEDLNGEGEELLPAIEVPKPFVYRALHKQISME